MLFSSLPNLLTGTLLQAPATDQPVSYLLTDSRKLIFTEGSLFFALKGRQQNGHHYVKQAYTQGIRLFIVEESLTEELPEAGVILVNNSLEALQNLAAYHRRQFQVPLVAITGSNGKTIIKEWLASLTPPNLPVVRSPKSYNSQLGVPLSVWQLEPQHELGIFEAGISQPGEMEKLAQILMPTLGIFTNLGSAHDAGFSSPEEKVKEKARLFSNCPQLIYCADHSILNKLLPRLLPNTRLISWSKTKLEHNTILVEEKSLDAGTQLTLYFEQETLSYTIPFKDKASLENITHCLVCLFTLNLVHTNLTEQLRNLPQPAMRLEMKQGVHGSILIDDAYNNDLAGLDVALGFMNQQETQGKARTIVLSDLPQTGRPDTSLYKNVAALLKNYKIAKLLAIGPALFSHQSCFAKLSEAHFWISTEDFLEGKPEKWIQNNLVLLKGARSFGFERITRRLEQKTHGTVLEIDLDALAHNLNFYRSKLKPGVKTMVMVKAFAYGSGSHEVARLLQFQKVDYLAVAYADEGVSLRQAGITLPIMVMNPSPETFSSLLDCSLEPEIYSLSQLKSFAQFLHLAGKQAKIHLKIDTGMHRLGFSLPELPKIIPILTDNPQLQVASIFSHLAGSDSPEFDEFSHSQAEKLHLAYLQITDQVATNPIKHLVNSAGILRFPEYQFGMVRLGIGLYGADAGGTSQHELMPISKLLATVSQVKEIAAGETVGYSRAGQTNRVTQVATLSIGYADGYDRRFSNGIGYVLINGQKAPVLGKVCMDMTMVDATEIKVEEGDEAVLFGPELPITELAKQIGTIPYEILTNVSERVKRVFYSG
jgi:alanine racemase